MKFLGYCGVGPETGNFIPVEDAYNYALERCANGTAKERAEFMEWFYSGNHIEKWED